uniref:Transcription initiation factor IIA gamma chain n=1 Tax=Sus scrofa TaxID=9823 RepID=A0A8D0MAB9_PIG
TIYQNTTLGNRLQQSFHELIWAQQVTPQLALRVLPQFDKAVNSALAQRVRNRVNFRGSLNISRQHWIPNPLSEARDRTHNLMIPSWIH